MNYPEDCLQNLTTSWWEKTDSKDLVRGALVWAHVQFFSQIPLELVPQREDSNKHDRVIIKAKPLSARGKQPESVLPVAAFPRLDGADCYLVNRAKQRPCIVIGNVYTSHISKTLTRGMSTHQTAPFVAIAPYYGVEQKARSGFNPAFVERVRHAAYPQWMWDVLPHSQKESILRLDQIQPLGVHHQSYSHTGFKLSTAALKLFDEHLYWLLNGKMGEELSLMKELIKEFED